MSHCAAEYNETLFWLKKINCISNNNKTYPFGELNYPIECRTGKGRTISVVDMKMKFENDLRTVDRKLYK